MSVLIEAQEWSEDPGLDALLARHSREGKAYSSCSSRSLIVPPTGQQCTRPAWSLVCIGMQSQLQRKSSTNETIS